MRWTIVAVLGLAFAMVPPAARADDASRLRLAHDVVALARVADNMRAAMPLMVAQMRTLLTQQGNADAQQIDVCLKRFQQRFDEQIPPFVDLVAQVYAREFSEEDLGNPMVFYRTPTGHKILGKQQEITKGLILVGQQWGKTVAEQVLGEIQKEKAAPPKL